MFCFGTGLFQDRGDVFLFSFSVVKLEMLGGGRALFTGLSITSIRVLIKFDFFRYIGFASLSFEHGRNDFSR